MLVYSVYDNMKNPNSVVLDALTALEATACAREIILAKIKDIGIQTPSTESQYNDLKADLNYTDMEIWKCLHIFFSVSQIQHQMVICLLLYEKFDVQIRKENEYEYSRNRTI